MNRAVPIAALLGFVAGALLVRWTSARQEPDARPDERPALSDPPAGAVSDSDVESLRNELGKEREQVERLVRDLAEARNAARASNRRPLRSWDFLGDRLRDTIMEGRMKETYGDLRLDVLATDAQSLLEELASVRGWTIHEAYASPDGWPALVAMSLKNVTPPLTPDESARLEEALAKCRRDAEDLEARRSTMTGLEILTESRRMANEFDSALDSALPEAHRDLLDVVGLMLKRQDPDSKLDGSMDSGPRAEVRADWIAEWSDALRLRGEQKAKLAPIMDELLDAVEALRGVTRSGGERQAKEMEAMIAAQLRILERVGLDEAQMAQFHDWTVVYSRGGD